jgi:hypothetical protein
MGGIARWSGVVGIVGIANPFEAARPAEVRHEENGVVVPGATAQLATSGMTPSEQLRDCAAIERRT